MIPNSRSIRFAHIKMSEPSESERATMRSDKGDFQLAPRRMRWTAAFLVSFFIPGGLCALELTQSHSDASVQVPQSHSAQRTAQDESAHRTYLALVLRLREHQRTPQVLKADQLDGKLITSSVPSQIVYTITRAGAVSEIGFLPDDPLIRRGFQAPGKGEIKGIAESTTITLQIPSADMQTVAAGMIGVRFYRVKSGFGQGLTSDQLKALQKAGKALLEFELRPSEFAKQIKSLPNE